MDLVHKSVNEMVVRSVLLFVLLHYLKTYLLWLSVIDGLNMCRDWTNTKLWVRRWKIQPYSQWTRSGSEVRTQHCSWWTWSAVTSLLISSGSSPQLWECRVFCSVVVGVVQSREYCWCLGMKLWLALLLQMVVWQWKVYVLKEIVLFLVKPWIPIPKFKMRHSGDSSTLHANLSCWFFPYSFSHGQFCIKIFYSILASFVWQLSFHRP